MKHSDHRKKIILRAPNPLGDFIMSLPAAEQIGRNFEDAEAIVMARPAYMPLLNGLDWYDSVISYDKQLHRGAGGFLKAAGRIRRTGGDTAVLFTNSFSSALMMKLAGVKERIGYLRDRRGWLLTGGPEPKIREGRIVPLPMVDYYAELSRYLGCGSPENTPRLELTEEENAEGACYLEGLGIDPATPLLGLVPGAGYGGAKMWPTEYFARAADILGEIMGALPVIFTQSKDALTALAIGEKMTLKPLDLSEESSSTARLKQLLGRCSLVLTTDSGPRHVAAALGIPVVVVIGSADPIYSTTGHHRVALEQAPVDCSPCMLRECPTDHRCMTRLKPEQVVRAATTLLDRKDRHQSTLD